MRTIKELLQLMLDNQQLFTGGLCSWKNNLFFKDLISYKELEKIQEYIRNNPPTIYKSFGLWDYLFNEYESYYWKPRKIEPRIKWLKYHIKKNS